MSHQIASMAYVGEIPWHGLGHSLPPRQPIEVWQRKAGMDFEIEETPVQYMSDRPGVLGTIQTFPEQKVLYRSDNNAPLSVVSQRYQVVQPREVLEFYRDLSEIAGYELETAGVLKGGRKFWALARTGQSVALKGKDVVNGYLLLATSCDGTLATTGTPTTVRVVCSNTLAIALNGAPQAQLKQSIQAELGNATQAVFDGGEVSWKRTKDSVGLDTATLLRDQPELKDRYSTVKPGSRRFLIA